VRATAEVEGNKPKALRGAVPVIPIPFDEALADGLDLVFKLRAGNKPAAAFQLCEKLLPQIVSSLQNLELFLFCEKRRLQARGLLSNSRCRSAGFTPDSHAAHYVDEMNDHIIQALDNAALSATSERTELGAGLH